MTDHTEEFGPWIEHDGMGCPVKAGTIVEVVRRNGLSDIYPAQTQLVDINGNVVGFARHGTRSSWVFTSQPAPCEIIRYRVKKPRGLSILEGCLTSIPKVRVEV